MLSVFVVCAFTQPLKRVVFSALNYSIAESRLPLFLEDIVILHNAVNQHRFAGFGMPFGDFQSMQVGDIRDSSLADAYWLSSAKNNWKRIKVWRWIHSRDYFKFHSLFINPSRTLTFVVTTEDYPSTSRIAARATTENDMDLAIAPLSPVPVDLRHNPSSLSIPVYIRLAFDRPYRKCQDSRLNESDEDEPACKLCELPLYCYVFIVFALIEIMTRGIFLFIDNRYIRGAAWFLVGGFGFLSIETSFLFCDPFFCRAGWLALSEKGDPYRCQHKARKSSSEQPDHNGISVTQKYVLTSGDLCITLIGDLVEAPA
jgi:hypothetical protein